jgi:hypothetical protein
MTWSSVPGLGVDASWPISLPHPVEEVGKTICLKRKEGVGYTVIISCASYNYPFGLVLTPHERTVRRSVLSRWGVGI